MNEDRRALLEQNREFVQKLKTVSGIVVSPEEQPVPSSAVSMKKCFSRDHLDAEHIDSLVLKKIARSMARIMRELEKCGIFPGLYDMREIFVDMRNSEYPVMITCPERFQIGDAEQDYEWYPEDERLLPDTTLFDQDKQDRANQRFLFRILVGSSRGNIRFPPVRSEMDYAQIFYNILPDEWKESNEKGEVIGCEEWIRLLSDSIRSEETFAKKIREREKKQPPGESGEGDAFAVAGPDLPGEGAEGSGGKMHVLFILLRTDLTCADSMSKLLYNSQEELEGEVFMRRYQLSTAIVHGDGAVQARDFRQYPPKFRFQVASQIGEYPAGEALVVGASLLEQRKEEEGSCRVVILLDGRIPNDAIFKAGLAALREAVKEDIPVTVRSQGDVDCEAFENLKLLDRES